MREMVVRRDTIAAKIHSAENLADPFTKTLPYKVFEAHLEGMRVRNMPNWN